MEWSEKKTQLKMSGRKEVVKIGKRYYPTEGRGIGREEPQMNGKIQNDMWIKRWD